jgi:predicted lactoylglutathione lyase
MIFVNLPVRDLDASMRFYEAIGCDNNPQFTNDQAAMMTWSDTISFMLLTRDYFATFTDKEIADSRSAAEVLLALSRDSRDDVDAIVEAAARAGGRADVREPQDTGFMYGRAFEDPDGHVFEPVWMDPAAIEARV